VKLVLDTNVVVSALLKPESVPALALAHAFSADVFYDARISDEYRSVLERPKLRLEGARIESFFTRLRERGHRLDHVPPFAGPLPDESDRIFVEAALAAGALLVTGNAKDYPPEAGVAIVSPAALVGRATRGAESGRLRFEDDEI